MKILLVKTSSLGDIIQTFPTLVYLRSLFPDAEIDWVVEQRCAELLFACPLLNRVLPIESKKWGPFTPEYKKWRETLREKKYDVAFDLQGNCKSGAIMAHVRSHDKVGFGKKTVAEWPNLLFTSKRFNPPPGKNIREDYLALIRYHFQGKNQVDQLLPFDFRLTPLEEQTLAQLFAEPVQPTLVSPFSAWPNKCLSQETLCSVLKKLNRGPYWFIWGSPKEREKAIQLGGHFQNSRVLEKLSLPLLQHVMAKAQLLIAMDSLPLHLCATTLTPTISFFGPSSALKYAPQGAHHQTYQGECPYGETFEKRCPKLRTCPTGACIQKINEPIT